MAVNGVIYNQEKTYSGLENQRRYLGGGGQRRGGIGGGGGTVPPSCCDDCFYLLFRCQLRALTESLHTIVSFTDKLTDLVTLIKRTVCMTVPPLSQVRYGIWRIRRGV